MAFLWPGFLYLLLLLPALVGFYAWLLRRRSRYALRYSSLTLVRGALQHSAVRRHLPFALFVLSLGALAFAIARPVQVVTIPASQATIILAIDVSRSMCSIDIPPTRIQAAESAAITYIRHQRPNAQIGIVAFAGFAELIQRPTNDQEALQSAIEGLLTGRGTAIGAAVLRALDAIAEVDHAVAPSESTPAGPAPKGIYAPDIIVLLTDGANNAGPSPVDAAQQASLRGVRVYTIGFGTPNGSEIASCQSSDPSALGGFGGIPGSGGIFRFRRGIDETMLKQIAGITGGAYYPASSAHELEAVFQRLPTALTLRHEYSEISVAFAAAGALLVALAIALSFMWHPLP